MDYWILVVDDEPLSLTNAKNLLHSKNMRVSCLRSGKDMLKYIENHDPDLILLDILMPDMDGFETYRELRKYEDREGKPQTPVIFLTGEDNSETERRGLKAGASDYIHKPFDEDILINRIKNTIINSKTIESLTEEATLDKLTGLLNKASGTEKITELCKDNVGSLMIFDLDNFKLVNDLYGHDMGDRVLSAFSGVVKQNVRADDVICRIGGDEFMGFFMDMTEEEAVASLADRLNKGFLSEADSLMGEDHGIPLGISIGCAVSAKENTDYQILFQYADSALYEVKRNGKHGFRIYDGASSGQDKEEDLDSELERVIKIVSERGEHNGALLLGQDAFSSNYQFIERYLLRYGGTVSRVLFSLSSDDNEDSFPDMVTEFGNILKNALRKTDLIFQCKQNCYFVALPLYTDSDVTKTVERIIEMWEGTEYKDMLNIKYASSSLRKGSYES